MQKEQEGYTVIITSVEASMYEIPYQIHNRGFFDLLLNGNLGYNGEEKILQIALNTILWYNKCMEAMDMLNKDNKDVINFQTFMREINDIYLEQTQVDSPTGRPSIELVNLNYDIIVSKIMEDSTLSDDYKKELFAKIKYFRSIAPEIDKEMSTAEERYNKSLKDFDATAPTLSINGAGAFAEQSQVLEMLSITLI